MAGCDYYNCDYCGNGKIFYDANIDWEFASERIGQIKLICDDCYKKDIRLVLMRNNKRLISVEKHNNIQYILEKKRKKELY